MNREISVLKLLVVVYVQATHRLFDFNIILIICALERCPTPCIPYCIINCIIP